MNQQVAIEKIERSLPADPMVSMLERVLMDPSIPVERLERLLELRAQERAQEAKFAFSDAMSLAQGEMKAVLVDKENKQTNSKYASYAALDNAIRPVYSKHGFSVTFDTEDCGKDDYIRVVAYVSNAGHERRYHLDMPADGKGAKGGDVMTKTHAVMSATRYGQRGLLIMIFNIATSADRWDDDGNAAGKPVQLVSEQQVEKLRSALKFVDGDEELFCKHIGVADLKEILAINFDTCLRGINRKRASA